METKSTMAFYDVQNPIAEKDYVAIVKNVTSIKHIRCILVSALFRLYNRLMGIFTNCLVLS